MLQAGATEPLQIWLSVLVHPSYSNPEVAEATVTSMLSLGEHDCAVHNFPISLCGFRSLMPRSELAKTSPNFSRIFLVCRYIFPLNIYIYIYD